jgi:hypothetical protein
LVAETTLSPSGRFDLETRSLVMTSSICVLTKMRLLSQTILVLSLTAWVGCGGHGTVPVQGIVTLDGAPLADANVIFHSATEGRPAVARTDAEGRFVLSSYNQDGAYPGDYTVTIVAVPKVSEEEMNADPMQDLDQHIAEGMKHSREEFEEMGQRKQHQSLVHEKYTNVAKSPLKVKVPVRGPLELKLNKDGT